MWLPGSADTVCPRRPLTTLGQDVSDWSRDLATLTFDLGGQGACGCCGSSSSIRVPSLKFEGLTVPKIWRTMRVTINRPGKTLTFGLGGHAPVADVGRRPPSVSLKFVGLTIQKICRTMCVCINEPGDLDLWPFDLETGMWVASKVGNLRSEFQHARPSDSPVIHYVRDGRMDGRTDGQKQTLLPLNTGGGIKRDKMLQKN